MPLDLPIPTEITEQIVDSLEGDPDALKTFTLVSRSGLLRCREYLHHNIYIRAGDATAVQRQLQRYSLPHLRTLVRLLRIDGSQCSDLDLCDCISNLLKQLSSVRFIVINENLLHPVTADRLIRATPYPDHVSLHIGPRVFTSQNFYRLLKSLPALSRLVLHTVRWNWPDENWHPGPELASSAVLPNLRSLEMSYCMQQDQFLRWLCTDNSTLGIVFLSIMEGGFPASLNTTLHALRNSLTHLELHETFFAPDTSLVLNELKALQWLSLGSVDIMWSINALCAASLPSLARILLIFRVTSIEDFASEVWYRLDGALSTSFPQLDEFVIEVVPWHETPLPGGILGGTLVRLEPQVFRAIEYSILSHLSRTHEKTACCVREIRDNEEDDR